MRLQRVEALEVEQRLDQPLAGGIAVEHGENVGAEGVGDRRVGLQHARIGVGDGVGAEVGMVESRGDAMDDRPLQRLVMQHVGEQEAGEIRLAAHGVLRIRADAREQRVLALEIDDGRRGMAVACCRHD